MATRIDYSIKDNFLKLINDTAPVKDVDKKNIKNAKLFDNIGSDFADV